MKALYNTLTFLALSTSLFGQNYETVKSKEITGTADQSYIVNDYGKILPTTIISGVNGPFFLRANPSALPSLDQNFVRSETLLSPVTVENNIFSLPASQKQASYEYIDGLGRKSQSISVQTSPLQKDVVVPFEYDNYGRVLKEYLPFVSNQTNGAFRLGAATEQGSFYSSPGNGIAADARAFKENIFEPSPFNRITDVYGSGTGWKNSDPLNPVDKKTSTLNTLNTASESIIQWKHYSSGFPEKHGTYSSNQLKVIQTTDEQGMITRIYEDLMGKTVLSRSGDGTNWFDTYYLYNPAGSLTMVIQPEGSFRLGNEFEASGADKQSFINRWCFQYQYDEEQRVVAKRLPGWKPGYWAYTVYDKWNRPVFSQSPAQKDRNEWTFNKYDQFNRLIISGLYISSSSREILQSNVNLFYINNPNNRFESTEVSATGYTLSSTYPQSPAESSLTLINYYDSYWFKGYSNWDAERSISNYEFENKSGYLQYDPNPATSAILHTPKGLITGSKVRVLGQSRWLNNVIYYDREYQIIQTISENFIGGTSASGGLDRITSKIDFAGRVEKTILNYSSPGSSVDILREMVYDHSGRILKTYQTTGGGSRVLLSSNVYNEVGQLIEKNIHSTNEGSSFLQSIDYRYNIRGWVTSINNSTLTNNGTNNNDSNDLFGMDLLYNPNDPPVVAGFPTPDDKIYKLYNGNISAVKWKMDTKQGTPEERIYGFEYDVLNRFKGAYYAKNNSGVWNGNVGMFNEVVKNYDRNGNIQGIERYAKVDGASSFVDDLTYTYNYTINEVPNFAGESNRVIRIQDTKTSYGFNDGANATEEYKYDASGNLIYDKNKQISSVSYNYLNLPEVVEFTRTNGSVDRIRYTYDANGAKLSTEVYQDGGPSSYGTPVWTTEYAGDVQFDNGQFSFASTPEGRVVKNNTTFDYEYFYKDHQNNIRLTYGLLKETISYRATMEDPSSPSTLGNDEEALFRNIEATRYQNSAGESFNYTKSSDQVLIPDRSSHTNGFISSRRVGPAKSLVLGSGDKVKMEVFAKYTQTTGNSSLITAAALVSAVTGTFNITPGENPVLYSGFNNNVPVVPGSGSGSSTLPKAYLAYLFFSDNDVFITSAAIPISTNAYNAFEKLERTFTAPQSGKLYVYVTNESSVNSINGSVYFDEMLIIHQKNSNALQVTQANDYYPFGLTFNSYQAERISETFTSVRKNRYGFQGQEWQKHLDLGWSQFKWRMHDPAIGRFVSVDPLSDKYVYNSTFAFQENKLGLGVELEGLELTGPKAFFGRARAVQEFGKETWQFVSKDMWDINTYKNGLIALSYMDPMNMSPEAYQFKANIAQNVINTAKDIPNWDSEDWHYAMTKGTLELTTGLLADKGFSKLKALKYVNKLENFVSLANKGKWIKTTESMSEAAAKYQKYITGRNADESFLLNDVKFDGMNGERLMDAKSGYTNFVNKKTGKFHNWFEGADELLDQARRQINAAEGSPVDWYFENQSVRDATQKLFDANEINGINLIYKGW